MIRLRTSLLLLALMALLLSGTSAFAGSGDPALPSWTAAPATIPALAAGQGPAPQLSLADGTPVLPTPRSDFILCSCTYCAHHPDVICRISPTGFSIVCSNYSQMNCQ